MGAAAFFFLFSPGSLTAVRFGEAFIIMKNIRKNGDLDMKYSGIGGQAVLEGVMMKNGSRYAVAVRKPDKTIEVKKDEYKSFSERYKICSLPLIRGVFGFVDSLILGMGTLNWSASFYEEEGEPKNEKKDAMIMGLATVLAVVLAVGLFMMLPVFLSNLLKPLISSVTVLSLVEGFIRLVLFILYVVAISLMEDIRRVYMYHGAEHKCINCLEHGLILNKENVMKSSKEHKRCGTSFLLLIMLISILLFTLLHVEGLWLRMLSRVLLIPLVAGLAYEFLRAAGRSDNCLINALSKPGLWLQGLTTKEPDEDMVEVAIASVEAVFDWRAYLKENFDVDVPEEAGEMSDVQ